MYEASTLQGGFERRISPTIYVTRVFACFFFGSRSEQVLKIWAVELFTQQKKNVFAWLIFYTCGTPNYHKSNGQDGIFPRIWTSPVVQVPIWNSPTSWRWSGDLTGDGSQTEESWHLKFQGWERDTVTSCSGGCSGRKATSVVIPVLSLFPAWNPMFPGQTHHFSHPLL